MQSELLHRSTHLESNTEETDLSLVVNSGSTYHSTHDERFLSNIKETDRNIICYSKKGAKLIYTSNRCIEGEHVVLTNVSLVSGFSVIGIYSL